MKTKIQNDTLLTVSEAGQCLGLAPQTVVYHCNEMHIQSTRTFGGIRLIRYGDVVCYAKLRGFKMLTPQSRRPRKS